MNVQNDSEFEQRLRGAFEPDPESIDRVVAAAMGPRPRRSMRLRVAAALTLAGILIVAVIVLFLPAHRLPESIPPDYVDLEYVGNVAVLKFPDGSSWIVSTETANQGSPAYLNLIILEGDKP